MNAIEIRDLGKQYIVHSRNQQSYHSLRDDIIRFMKGPFTWLSGSQSTAIPFWALRDITLDVARGEVLGIIGANGAGKSTLLKILSRITYPTQGSVTMCGNVGSLLEVGTGFHPELSGRENIYLNGSILGMPKSEIDRKFDEIVDFSGIEQFLDTPVKYYSSGMSVRLAFSVAAHLEPDILIVDEVLAVGDADFQKKSLGKMEQITKGEGRTILFVSHNMAAINSLCKKVVLLSHGMITKIGSTQDVIDYYLNDASHLSCDPLSERTDREGTGKIRFTSIEILGPNGDARVETGKPFRVRLHFDTYQQGEKLSNVAFAFSINDVSGNILTFWTETSCSNYLVTQGMNSVECEIEVCPLVHGEYHVNVYAAAHGVIADYVLNAERFSIDDSDYFINGRRDHESHPRYVAKHVWRA
ncbi:MAG: ABC transporter ATP-binding protein [Patescibacteria group bacterium]